MSVPDDLRLRYQTGLSERREQLDAALAACLQDPTGRAAIDALCGVVHRLAGSAGAYGFEQVGGIARDVERRLIAWKRALDGHAAADIEPFRAELAVLGRLLSQALLRACRAA